MPPKDGTRMHCPFCNDLRICQATDDHLGPMNRNQGYGEVRYFHRWRKCLKCKRQWETAELSEKKLEELQLEASMANYYKRMLDEVLKAVKPLTKRKRRPQTV